MISVKNVIKRYGTFTALKDLSFDVQKGEILGFLGPNGAGKTTLMRILTGYFPPSEGHVFINNSDIETNPIALKKTIGYLPEHVPLYQEMTVESFLKYVATVKMCEKAARQAHIERVMGECGLVDMRHRTIAKLSKGYKQRVGLAQAMIGDPDVLVLDEPTTGLDPKQIIEIRSLIKNMAGDKTVILSTHILPEVSVICDRVVIINEGKIVAIDTPENLERRLSSGLTVRVVVRGDRDAIAAAVSRIDGVESVETSPRSAGIEGDGGEIVECVVVTQEECDVRPRIASTLAHSFELLEMKTLRLSLEDIFVKLVTEEGGDDA